MESRPARPSRVPRRALVAVLGLLALAVSFFAWALASPVGASPDEDYHLASIWCAQGERDDLCEPGHAASWREVQDRLLNGQYCYNFRPEESAACQGTLMSDGTRLVDSDRGNFVGAYPPAFYFAMSFLAGDQVVDSIIAMRAANAVLAVLLLATVWLAAPPGLRRGLVGGAAVTLVPLGMFVLPSVNPSSWAVLSAMTLPVAILGYITTEDRRRRWVLGALAALALGLGAGARADAAMYAALAIGLAGIMTLRTGWAHVRRLLYPALLGVVAVAMYFATGQAESVGTAERPDASLSGIAELVAEVPDLWTGALGGWPLGWVDTHMPAVVAVASWSMFAGCVFAALAGASRRQLVALALGGAALWVVPSYMQYLTGLPVGVAIQPRYILPIVVIIAVLAMSRTQGTPVRWSGGQWLLVCAALAVANGQALHTNLRRYVTGLDVTSLNLDAGAEWWWSGLPVGPNAVWAVGTLAFAVALVLLTWSMRAPGRPVVEGAADVADDDLRPGRDARDEGTATPTPADEDLPAASR